MKRPDMATPEHSLIETGCIRLTFGLGTTQTVYDSGMDAKTAAGVTTPLDTLVPINQIYRSSASRALAKAASITRERTCQG